MNKMLKKRGETGRKLKMSWLVMRRIFYADRFGPVNCLFFEKSSVLYREL